MKNIARDVRWPTKGIQADVNEILERSDKILAKLEGKHVVVTGGGGFLLSYLVDVLAAYSLGKSIQKACRVTVVDNYQTGVPVRLQHIKKHPFVSFRKLDAARPFVLKDHPNVIVHGASIASPSIYRQFPLETAEVNAWGTYHLLKSSLARSLDSFVLMSTSEVYGDPVSSAIPTPETYNGNVSCTGLRSCYDESKRFAETLGMIFFRSHKVPVRIIRPFNVYGPGMRLDDRRVLPDFARCVLEGKNIEMLSNGSPTRTFCYVTDFIVGLLLVMLKGEAGGIYNVGSDEEEISMRDLAHLLIQVDGQGRKVEYLKSEDTHYLSDNPQRRAPDLSRLRSLGYSPAVNLKKGLKRYLTWARESGEIQRIAKRAR